MEAQRDSLPNSVFRLVQTRSKTSVLGALKFPLTCTSQTDHHLTVLFYIGSNLNSSSPVLGFYPEQLKGSLEVEWFPSCFGNTRKFGTEPESVKPNCVSPDSHIVICIESERSKICCQTMLRCVYKQTPYQHTALNEIWARCGGGVEVHNLDIHHLQVAQWLNACHKEWCGSKNFLSTRPDTISATFLKQINRHAVATAHLPGKT